MTRNSCRICKGSWIDDTNQSIVKRKSREYCSISCKNKGNWIYGNARGIKGINVSEKNGMWKDALAGYHAIHAWVRTRKPKPEKCESCDARKPIDLANISQKYLRDVNDFEWLCRKCHMKKDGRVENLKLGRAVLKLRHKNYGKV